MPGLSADAVDTSVTQAELIRRARAGDPTALAALYDRHGDALFRACRRLTGSAADADDLVHDLFVGLPEALGRYEERGTFEAWLERVAVRLALMHLRSKRRRREVPLEAAAGTAARYRTDERIEGEDLDRALASLPDPLRAVFVLKQIEGYSHREIAKLLGITDGASRVRLNRALQALREALG